MRAGLVLRRVLTRSASAALVEVEELGEGEFEVLDAKRGLARAAAAAACFKMLTGSFS